MIVAARVVCKAPLTITQGGYNAGGVAASAGTHDRDALDIRATTLSVAERKEAVNILRKVGFAAWLRNPDQASKANPWPWHIHCIPVGGDLSAGAADQVEDYQENRNGLASNGKDDGPRTWVSWTWEKYAATYPDLLVEDDVQQADIDKIVNAVVAKLSPVVQSYSAFNAKNLTQQLAGAVAEVEKLDQKYAVAVNNFTAQTDDEDEILAGITGLKTALTSLAAEVDQLQEAAAPKA